MESKQFTWGGFNIKGTPSMSADKVAHDLKVIKTRCDVFGVQEFRWPWYWQMAQAVLPKRPDQRGWRSHPSSARSLIHPVAGGQAIMWKAREFQRHDKFTRLLHPGAAHISETRWVRGALLSHRSAPDLAGWFASTHNVVGGDAPTDSSTRKAILDQDLEVISSSMRMFHRTGQPQAWEIDGNIHQGTVAYQRLVSMVTAMGGEFHGVRGVEFMWTIPGRHSRFEVQRVFQVPTSELFTDHEGRCADVVLVGRPAA